MHGPGSIACRLRNGIHDGFKQRLQIFRSRRWARGGGPCFGVCVQDWEIKLLFFGIQINEEIVNFVEHFLRARVGAVNLIDHDNLRQSSFKRLTQHVTRLRQRAFARIYQQHDAVHHLQRAFHFAAEIAVARSIYNVDFCAVIKQRGVLGENRNPTLAFEFVRIHDAIDVGFVGAECATLLEHRVN